MGDMVGMSVYPPDPLIISQGDDEPNLNRQLMDGDDPIDLSSDVRYVEFKMHLLNHDHEVTGRTDIVDDRDGIVEYDWDPGDTDVPGLYRARFVINYVGGNTRTIPVRNYLNVIIEKR